VLVRDLVDHCVRRPHLQVRTTLKYRAELVRDHVIAMLVRDQDRVGCRQRVPVADRAWVDHQAAPRTFEPHARVSPDCQLGRHGFNISRRPGKDQAGPPGARPPNLRR